MIKVRENLNDFVWNTIGSVLNSFNSLFLIIIISRINGLEEAGTFSICMATAYILYVFAIYSGRNCQITDVEDKIKDKDYIVSRSITCLGMIILTFVFALISGYNQNKMLLLICLCVWKSTEAFSDVFYGIFQKNNKLNKVRNIFNNKINYRNAIVSNNNVLYT